MARRTHSVSELREIAARLKSVGKTLDSVALFLENKGCQGVNIHADTITGRYLPSIEEWVLVTEAAATIQASRKSR